MKKLLLLSLTLALAFCMNAQSYSSGSLTGTSYPYDFNAAGTQILTGTVNDTFTTVQTIPFTFTFYGQPVTSYKASDNGYITFNTAGQASNPNNVALPSATAPMNAIFAFWDDWQLANTGTPDAMYSWTYGTAPNRVHVVQWYSVAYGSSYGYFAIRLYECGDFDIVHDWTTATTTSATVGCQNASGSAGTQVTGSPSFGYSTGAPGSATSDDKVYTFAWSGVGYDMSLESVSINNTNYKEFLKTSTNYTVSGTVKNNGANTLTSFRINYTINGGAPASMNVTSVSLAPGATYNFTHSTPINLSTPGTDAVICAYADQLNGSNADQRSCNDQICGNYVTVNGTTGTKKVLIEEFTGAWCGYCPDGGARLLSILGSTPEAVGVAVHDNDNMDISDNIRSFFNVTGYPSGNIDRYWFQASGESAVPTNRGSWQTYVNDRKDDFTPVNVAINHTYNAGTRAVSGTVTATFTDYAKGDFQMVLMLVEDSVTGSGTGWDQTNYYNNPAQTPYYGSNPITGFQHRHVLRALPWGSFGNAGDINDTTPSPADVFNKTISFTVPAAVNPERASLVAFVAYYDANNPLACHVLNVADVALVTGGVAVEEELVDFVNVYPNPASGEGYVEMNFTQTTDARVSVVNVHGQEIAVLRNDAFAAGKHYVNFNVSDVAPGVYFVKIATAEKSYTKKVVVVH